MITIKDIEGNVIEVTDLKAAIRQCRDCLNSPFKTKSGHTIGEDYRFMLGQLEQVERAGRKDNLLASTRRKITEGKRLTKEDMAYEIGRIEACHPASLYCNDKKVTDHHALIITENMPGDISADQRIIYDMIAARIMEAFSEKSTKENTTVSLDAAGVPFTVKGSVILIPGWRAVLNAPEEENDDEEAAALPSLSKGDVLPINGADLLEKQTKPRPLHTESSLLSSMETCEKELTDEAEREALKESGIGTPATRAAIIETLFSREYIVREKKSLVPTNKGLAVYLAVRDKKIADVSMTGEWENALNKIATGEMNADTFHRGIEVYAAQITAELLESKIEGGNQRESCPCPKCKNGQVTIYQKVAKCSNEDCGLVVFRNKSGKDLTDGQIKDLLIKGKTGIIKGFKSKENKPFDAVVSFDSEYKAVFSFPPKSENMKKRK